MTGTGKYLEHQVGAEECSLCPPATRLTTDWHEVTLGTQDSSKGMSTVIVEASGRRPLSSVRNVGVSGRQPKTGVVTTQDTESQYTNWDDTESKGMY